ncbi:MAG: (d)CMP kinase [Promethearchaeota archaeon]
MKLPNVITIDGPVASGKSSVGLKIAKELGYIFLDTGIMYRAVAWAAINRNVNIDDVKEVGTLAQQIVIEIKPPTKSDGRINDVFVDKVNVTWKIREPEVNENVSQVSRYQFVRKVLTEQQQEFGRRGKIVMAGRDIGTIVMPNADLKIFLEASVKERALRRYNEELKRGKQSNLEDVIKNVEMRDRIDSSREIAPLIPAEDAVIINTDGKDISRVVDEILNIIRNY